MYGNQLSYWAIHPFVIHYLHDFALFILFLTVFVAVVTILIMFTDMVEWPSDNATIKVETTFATFDSGSSSINQRDPSGSSDQPNPTA